MVEVAAASGKQLQLWCMVELALQLIVSMPVLFAMLGVNNSPTSSALSL